MNQEHVVGLLSDYLDGELPPDRRGEVELHLKGCEACRRARDQLAQVVRSARSLGGIEPTDDLWSGVLATIRKSGAPLRIETGGLGWPERPVRRRLSLSLPQAVAAGLAVSLISAGLASGWARNDAVPQTVVEAPPPSVEVQFTSRAIPEELSAELADLERLLAERSDALDASTLRILQRNLAVIDRAIRESLEALFNEPSDPFLEGHLESQVRRKVDVLRRAAELTMAAD